MKALLFAVAQLLVFSACSSFVDPEVEIFTLATVNEAALPGPHPDSPYVEIAAGSLALYPEGRLVVEQVVRCKSDLPYGVTCEAKGDRRTTSEGAYSREEGWTQFETSNWPMGPQYMTEFEPDLVRISVSKPHSSGLMQPFRFEYRR